MIRQDAAEFLKEKIGEKTMMIKTTAKLCRKCKYSSINGQGCRDIACMYLEKTGKRRGCPVGMCDKHESKKRARNKAKEKQEIC